METKGIGPTPAKITKLNISHRAAPAEPLKEPAKVIEFQRKASSEPVQIDIEAKREKTAYVQDLNSIISEHNIKQANTDKQIPTENEINRILADLTAALKKTRPGKLDEVLVHNIDPQRAAELLKD